MKTEGTHQPCPDCGSSDALTKYVDHTYCFSCQKYTKLNNSYKRGTYMPYKKITFLKGEIKALPKRGLTEETCAKFGYEVGFMDNQPVQIANYKRAGKIIGQKIRLPNKKFIWKAKEKAGLYGQHLWGKGGKRIIITEGEIDAMSVSQIQGHKWPVVSIPHGAQSAHKAIREELEYLETFDEVILMLDNDEIGEKAAYDCTNILSAGKTKVAVLPRKDPNEMLLHREGDQLISAIWQAEAKMPGGIINAYDTWDIINSKEEKGLDYPWKTLTELTYGIRLSELTTLGAGTGLGKSTCIKQIAYHLATFHEKKIGLFLMEENIRNTIISFMSINLQIPLHLSSVIKDENFMKESFENIFKNKNIFIFENMGANKFEDLKVRIRYLATSCQVKYVFIDHLTAMTSSEDFSVNERRELDLMMRQLADLVNELKIHIFLVSHLATPETGAHEEGARVTIRHFRGSRSIGYWSHNIFALERNQQAEDEEERNTSTFRILKERFTGQAVGKTFKLIFNSDSQLLVEESDFANF